MMVKILILLISLSYSCAHFKAANKISEKKQAKSKDYKVKNEIIHPGEVKFYSLEIGNLPDPQKYKINCNNSDVLFSFVENKLNFFVATSYFSEKKGFRCFLKEDKKKSKNKLLLRFKIKKKKYPITYLHVNKKRVFLSKKDKKRVEKEQQILKKIYENPAKEVLFSNTFQLPLTTKITEYYGTRRVFNKKKKTQHLGMDFRAPIGTEIPVTNDGVVVFAGDLFYTGNTVIVEHGLSLYSVYGHLSKISVDAGEKVRKGEVIGLSGNTGRVTGPHLHWGVKVAGEWINGETLLSLKTKDAE